jgi:arylsulfatase A-like enzyme
MKCVVLEQLDVTTLDAGGCATSAGNGYTRTREAGHSAKSSHKNFVFALIDDISYDRLPGSGNPYLTGKLPHLERMLKEGAIEYTNHWAPSSVCSPAQVAFFSGQAPAKIGGQHHFAQADYAKDGKANYAVVPEPDVEFLAEMFGKQGYYRVGAGKLDYQVGEVISTFYNDILGGPFTDWTQPRFMSAFWSEAM